MVCAADPAGARTWTDREGRQLEAELLAVEGDAVRVRRIADGREFSIPIERLSETDQQFIEAQRDEPAAAEEEPFEGLEWPRRVGLPENYDVEVIREDNDAEDYVYRTPNFEFRSNVKLARKVVREFGEIFEATYAAMQAFPLRWNLRPEGDHFITQLYRTKAGYYEAGGIVNSGGVYRGSERRILVPVTSLGVEKSSTGFTLDDSEDHATLIHEITHQVHHDWLSSLPVWVIEGMAVYMESVPYDDGEFRFDKRELEAFLRNEGIGEEYHIVAPSELMTISPREWNAKFAGDNLTLARYYNSAFLLMNYFLHLDGDGDGRRIHRYVRAIEAGQAEAEARQLLLEGRSDEDLFEDVQRAYKREDLDLTALGQF